MNRVSTGGRGRPAAKWDAMNGVPTCFSCVEYSAEFLEDLCVDFLVEFVGRADEAALGYADGECCFFC